MGDKIGTKTKKMIKSRNMGNKNLRLIKMKMIPKRMGINNNKKRKQFKLSRKL